MLKCLAKNISGKFIAKNYKKKGKQTLKKPSFVQTKSIYIIISNKVLMANKFITYML